MEDDQYIIYNPATDLFWLSGKEGSLWVEDTSVASRFLEASAKMTMVAETADKFLGCVYVKVTDDVPDYTSTLAVDGSY